MAARNRLAAKQARRASSSTRDLPLAIGGRFPAGDANAIPDGTSRELSGYLILPGRFAARPPFVYDGQRFTGSLALFDDRSAGASRLISVDRPAAGSIEEKAASGESWSTVVATRTGPAQRVVDFASYNGTLMMLYADWTAQLAPNGAATYNGSTYNDVIPFGLPNSGYLSGRAISSYIDRTFIAAPRYSFQNLMTTQSTADAYDWTSGNWTLTSCSFATITNGSTKTGRLTPTATTGANALFLSHQSAPPGIALGPGQPLTVRFDLRTDAVAPMPVTLQLEIVGPLRTNVTNYNLGAIILDSNGNVQRCTVSGLSGGAPPAWATTVGASTTDGAVTWVCDGSPVLGSTETVVPGGGSWTTVSVAAALSASAVSTVTVGPRLKFGNTASPTITLATIDVSYRDGLTDGDPAKQNRGAQIAYLDVPFFNLEQAPAGAFATIDDDSVLWSGLQAPTTFSTANTYRLRNVPGLVTAAIAGPGGKYVVFKRTAFWVFVGNDDPTTLIEIPIRMERVEKGVGAISPRGIDAIEDDIYFIGENEVYKFTSIHPYQRTLPEPLCGPGNYEEIMAKGANWVPSQPTYNMPLLAIDPFHRMIWVYTQKAVLYCYHMDAQQWSKHPTPNGAEVAAMQYDPTTREVYVAFGGYGLARLDFSAAPANDTIDNTVNTYPWTGSVVFKPLDITQPPRMDRTVDQFVVFHAEQVAGQSISWYVSYDQGKTWARSVTGAAVPALSQNGEFLELPLPLYESAPSVTLRLDVTGKAGETAWALSPIAYATVIGESREWQQNQPSGGSSTL